MDRDFWYWVNEETRPNWHLTLVTQPKNQNFENMFLIKIIFRRKNLGHYIRESQKSRSQFLQPKSESPIQFWDFSSDDADLVSQYG